MVLNEVLSFFQGNGIAINLQGYTNCPKIVDRGAEEASQGKSSYSRETLFP